MSWLIFSASIDPVLRDECGYDILSAWTQKGLLEPRDLEALRAKLLPLMTRDLGKAEDDSIFGRSFAALYLSIIAASDLETKSFSERALAEMVDVAERCLREENNLRGYVPRKGWAHATAHVADLLKFVARNPQLDTNQRASIVLAVAQRLRTEDIVFSWGEDSRLAATLLAVANRADLDASIFKQWFSELKTENKALWQKLDIDPERFISVRNQANTLEHLAARIARQRQSNVSPALRDALNTTLEEVDP